jgi:plastocyanin
MRLAIPSQLRLSAAAALLAGVLTGAVASHAVVGAEEATATIDNFTFAPARLTVKTGQNTPTNVTPWIVDLVPALER